MGLNDYRPYSILLYLFIFFNSFIAYFILFYLLLDILLPLEDFSLTPLREDYQ